MADADRLLGEFIEAYLAGQGPDPAEFVARADEGEREELEELIDAFYIDAPPRPWDAEAFKGSPAEATATRVSAALASESGLWPQVLPTLRHRARLKRSELVSRLAETLGVADRQEKVDMYYHGMEAGTLDSTGVSTRVLQAIAGIVGTTAERLRTAGESLGVALQGTGAGTGDVFARKARVQEEAGAAAPAAAAPPGDEELDEVDQLFLGGP